jgi:exopolysaccharide biosynthesis polyprenyl glycosylphosphotransferase
MLRSLQGPPLILSIFDLILTSVALMVAEWLRLHLPLGMPILPDTYYLTPFIYVVVLVIWATLFWGLGVYNPGRLATPFVGLRSLFVATSVAFFTFTSFVYLLKIVDFSRLLVLYFYILDLALLGGVRLALRLWLTSSAAPRFLTRRVAILGVSPLAQALGQRVHACESLGLRLMGYIPGPGEKRSVGDLCLPQEQLLSNWEREEALACLSQADEVLVCLPELVREEMDCLLREVEHVPANIRVVPDFWEFGVLRANVEDFWGFPLLSTRVSAISGGRRLLKRGLDLAGALVGLGLLWPVMVVIALAIKLDSPGPVLFVQERVGENGRPFRLFKFRSMVQEAEVQLGDLIDVDGLPEPVFKVKDDPRVTGVGRFLRRTSLDELPQLFNVLRGEMSLVGPRPEEKWLVERYTSQQRRRLQAPPGMTGPMQINGRADLSLDERVRLEVNYLFRYSIWRDIKILFQTIIAIITGRGAY